MTLFRYLILLGFWGIFNGCTDHKNDEIKTELNKDGNGSRGDESLKEKNESLVANELSIQGPLENELKQILSLEDNESVSIKKEFYEDGTPKEEIHFFAEIKDGLRRKWYPNGNLSVEGIMKEDKWHGEYKEWYLDGTPKVNGHYKHGKQQGEWLFFDKEGKALPSLYYDNGKEVTRILPKVFGD